METAILGAKKPGIPEKEQYELFLLEPFVPWGPTLGRNEAKELVAGDGMQWGQQAKSVQNRSVLTQQYRSLT